MALRIMVAFIFKKKAMVHVKENGPAVEKNATIFQKKSIHGKTVTNYAKTWALVLLRLIIKRNRYVHCIKCE
jgi:hypothetical protein